MRIDKYTWCVRLTKTRVLAAETISKGKIKLNAQEVKSSRIVAVGDVLSFQKHNALFEYEVLQIPKNRLGAKLVCDFLKDLTKPEEVEKYRIFQVSQSSYRQNGMGKPTTKERRDLNKFKGEGYD